MELLQLTNKGLYCALGDFYIDPWEKVETALITHAHGDHAHWGMNRYIAVNESEHILRKRMGEVPIETHPYGETFRMGDVDVSLHPAGHILGSSQVRIQYEDEVWVFTGDFKRDYDPTCEPFEVLPCDVFISEATFALPVYRWPDFQNEMKEILAWWMKNREEGFNSVLCCYALGKAQRIIAGLRELTDETIWVHGTVDELNHCYEKTGLIWPNVKKVPLESKEKFEGAMILCPPSALGSSWNKRLSPKKVAFASGWMRLRGNRRRKGYERGFVISDHADWPSLLRTVKETGCKKVYFTHGNTDAIVRYLKDEGLDAYDLKMPYDTEGES
ncbi:ligase-associated DNA damage response exonuclease [Peredibacter starrii]|uniref:Ligase-associated DNA damage response exonuclease n=1 Tax=Peredibacter starrii TaxID=28202 RepID=A0AAX4HPX0_9BACT|nr:ligase-associated DNA damage response exonuclease [Peredibacter starrii]WPU65175.1 ligase-associated DNA damage response exonuclease [Peredibacter starrii]